MTTEKLPTSSAPFQLGPGESSEYIAFGPSGSVQTMALRVVATDPDGSDGFRPTPQINLKAGSGAPVPITEFPAEQPIEDADRHIAGSATFLRKKGDTYLVRVSLDGPENDWRVQVVNSDSQARFFQVASLGAAKIRNGGDEQEPPSYCGRFPCACTHHYAFPPAKCPSCGHVAYPA
jgi:hypothetical protein